MDDTEVPSVGRLRQRTTELRDEAPASERRNPAANPNGHVRWMVAAYRIPSDVVHTRPRSPRPARPRTRPAAPNRPSVVVEVELTSRPPFHVLNIGYVWSVFKQDRRQSPRTSTLEGRRRHVPAQDGVDLRSRGRCRRGSLDLQERFWRLPLPATTGSPESRLSALLRGPCLAGHEPEPGAARYVPDSEGLPELTHADCLPGTGPARRSRGAPRERPGRGDGRGRWWRREGRRAGRGLSCARRGASVRV